MREFVVFTTQLYATASNSCRLVKTHYEYSEKGARQDRSTDKDGVFFDVFEVTVYTDVHTNKKISKYSFYSV